MARDAANITIVGGGHAAAQLADAVMRRRPECSLTLIGDEGLLPYQRPPLSKDYLAGRLRADRLLYRPREFYLANRIETRLGRKVLAVDRGRKAIALDDGSVHHYEQLALTTGCRVRRLRVPGAETEGVHYFRTVADVARIRGALAKARRVAIVGGGFIGLEAAAVLVRLGHELTVLEYRDRVLPRVVAPAVSAYFRARHVREGVTIVTDADITQIHGGCDKPLEIRCAGGDAFTADLIIVGIGVLPNVELAAECGLECDNGIVVDECARTSDPSIVAAGDCTAHPGGRSGRRQRSETVHNAVEQAKTAAASLCGGAVPYRQTPWVWSDQYDIRLQSAGSVGDCGRHLMRGDMKTGAFSVFHFEGTELVGVTCINRATDFAACRRILNEGLSVSHAQLEDPQFALQRLLEPRPPPAFESTWPRRAERFLQL